MTWTRRLTGPCQGEYGKSTQMGLNGHQASKKFQQSIQVRGLHSMVTLGTEGRGKKIQYLKINPIRGIIGRETKRLQTHGKEEW